MRDAISRNVPEAGPQAGEIVTSDEAAIRAPARVEPGTVINTPKTSAKSKKSKSGSQRVDQNPPKSRIAKPKRTIPVPSPSRKPKSDTAPQRPTAIPVTIEPTAVVEQPQQPQADLLDLSHVTVETTTNIDHLKRAVTRYGKVPGGIVVEGEATCDFRIHSLSIDAHQPAHLIVNGKLRVDSKLTAEELALLWDAVLVSGDAARNFGVISQQEAVGVPPDSVLGVTMMTADDYFGSTAYGYDTQFSLHHSSLPGYVNPFVEDARTAIFDERAVHRQCFSYLNNVRPRVFLTVTGTHFAPKATNSLTPASTRVSLAIGVLKGSEEIPTYLWGQPSTEMGLAASQFPFVYSAFNTISRNFAAFSRCAPSLPRTIAYAELVLLLRRAKVDRATSFGAEYVRRLCQERRSLPIPRFNYTLRSSDFANVAREAANRLGCFNGNWLPWDNLKAAILGVHYSTLAGDYAAFVKCQKRAAEYIAYLDDGTGVKSHANLDQTFDDIRRRLSGCCHDTLIEHCLETALSSTRTSHEKHGFLKDALRHCPPATLVPDNAVTRCRRVEVLSLLDPSHNPVPELSKVRKEDPQSVMAFASMNAIERRRLSEKRERTWFISSLESVQSFTRLSPEQRDLLKDELHRFGVSEAEYSRHLRNDESIHPAAVLAQLMADKLRPRPIGSFSPQYLHRENPFVHSHELLDHESPEQLQNFFLPIRGSILRFIDRKPPIKGFIRRLQMPFMKDRQPGFWWQKFLKAHSPSSDGSISKAALLLAFELNVRDIMVDRLYSEMRKHRTRNPQSALFFLDVQVARR